MTGTVLLSLQVLREYSNLVLYHCVCLCPLSRIRKAEEQTCDGLDKRSDLLTIRPSERRSPSGHWTATAKKNLLTLCFSFFFWKIAASAGRELDLVLWISVILR